MTADVLGPQNLAEAEAILEYLGGKVFREMTGAKNVVGDDNSLRFTLPSSPKNIKHVMVLLTPFDTFTMTFWKAVEGDAAPEIAAKYDDVSREDLQNLFTEATGLFTHF